jgi:hypothetical protein
MVNVPPELSTVMANSRRDSRFSINMLRTSPYARRDRVWSAD